MTVMPLSNKVFCTNRVQFVGDAVERVSQRFDVGACFCRKWRVTEKMGCRVDKVRVLLTTSIQANNPMFCSVRGSIHSRTLRIFDQLSVEFYKHFWRS